MNPTRKSHGGVRKGSGRKRTLDSFDEIHIGARAHNFQVKISERRAMRQHRQAMQDLGIAAAQKMAKRLLREKGVAHWESSFEGEETRDDIEFGLAEYHGDIEMENPPRVISLRLSTYGTRDYVLAVVSRWASWYYARPVPEDRVRKCLIEYRAFLRLT